MANTAQHVFKITGKIFSHPYDWGGNTLIPQTLGFEPEPGTPYAEYWIGVHKKALAQVELENGQTTTLDKIIEDNPEAVLGHDVYQKFGNLPFLFKLLDAGEMLSIQVHPNKNQAKEGYAREDALGIPLDDPKRAYKDKNFKSEYAVALDDFWLLHGFKQEDELRHTLSNIPEFQPLLPYFKDADYKKLYEQVMKEMSDEEVKEMLSPLIERVLAEYDEGTLKKISPDYWTAKAVRYMHLEDSFDRGIFSIYFLNLVNLRPGQGIFQPAGILHAYLEGQIIEIITNSDNVARGGITPKYIDVEELFKLVLFTGVKPQIIEPRKVDNEAFFDAPLDDFVVSKIQPVENKPYEHTAYSAEILVGINGNAQLNANGKVFSLKKGASLFVEAGTDYKINGGFGDIVYKTSVPKKS